MINSVHSLYIIDQSWCARRRNLQRTIKEKQIYILIMYVRTVESLSTGRQSQNPAIYKDIRPLYFTMLWNRCGFFDSPVCKPWPKFSLACRWRCGSVQMWSLRRRCSCWDSGIYQPRPATSQWMWLWSSRLHEPWSEMLPDYSSVQKNIKKLYWLTCITLRNLQLQKTVI